jgi:lipid A 3-O-deacylase
MTAGNARAQSLQSVSVRADNDAFNFWKPPYNRPDEEYTSGVRGSLAYLGAAWWERWLHRTCAVSCENGASHTFAIGQDMYTGTLVPGDTMHEPGTRPNAAWLYLQETSRITTADRLDETSLSVGVTGPPALGEAMQRFFHNLAPDLNRPLNWSEQVPFEPGIILSYDRTQRIAAVGDTMHFAFDVQPHAGASFGNILTEARAGLRVRVGYALQHPWQPLAERATPEISFFADVTGHGVLRNAFLAGTLFSDSPHVTERPFVAEYQLGLLVRYERLTLRYSMDQIGSEYFSRPNGHAWSRLAVEWQVGKSETMKF